jgi:hypothetical protein
VVGKDQLQAPPVREEPWDSVRPTTFFQEASVQQVGGADALVVDRRATQIGNTGVPIILVGGILCMA